MADIPTDGMKETATGIIETLGESMDFQRRDAAGEWQEASADVSVHRQPAGVIYGREPGGVDVRGCFRCVVGFDADILPGDRTALDGTWCLVTRLLDRGTHLEFILEQTAEAAE
jgi:hypothetical protein